MRDVLDRSGLAFLHPVSFMTARYRFEPFWVHAHLVERRNQRLYPGYEYRTCEQADSARVYNGNRGAYAKRVIAFLEQSMP